MIEIVEKTIAEHFRISRSDFYSKSQERDVTDAKHFLWYVLNTTYGLRVGIIAMAYSTSRQNVHYSITLIREGIKFQPFYEKHYHDILKEIRQNKK